MCGIAGIVGVGQSDERTVKVEKMASCLVHRGPDDSDYYHDDSIALAHRRLSINDIDGGRQPIANETNSIHLICNGEIYNSPILREALELKGHRFRTKSDVEVIIHLYEEYGKECVKHLQGMFAFALWDIESKTLLLARDHLGQKPLFYSQDAGAVTFASEVKAIRGIQTEPPILNIEALWHYMSMRYMPDEHTLFQGINKVEAGHTVLWQDGNLEIERYWDVSFSPKSRSSFQAASDELDELLTNTIHSHLLSDVKVGGFLSGGIDSSLILAKMANATNEKVPSFSIGVKEAGFNELPFAKMVSDKYDLEAHVEVVSADLVDLIPVMIHHLDEPADPYAVGVFLASKLASKHVKVVLTGDGADESFGGYDRYFGQQLADYYSMLPLSIRKHVIGRLSDMIPGGYGYKSFGQKVRWLNDMSFSERGERYANSMSTLRFTNSNKEDLFTDSAKKSLVCRNSNEKILEYFEADNAEHVVDRMLYTDIRSRLPDHLLTVSDRMSMAHSLESRAPFVDYKLVEFAASLPASYKVKGSKLKHILREVSKRHLPTELVTRKKQGFGFPLGPWLRDELADFMRDLFKNSRFVEIGVFSQDFIDELVEQHVSGQFDHNYRLWMLINLEIWYRLYFDGMSVDGLRTEIKDMRNN